MFKKPGIPTQEFIDSFDETRSEGIKQNLNHSPEWFIQVLLAFAAWMAASFFILFLVLVKIIESHAAMMSIGAIFFIASIFLSRIRELNSFAEQLVHAAQISGQILFLVGFQEGVDYFVYTLLFALAFELLVIAFYESQFMKFMAGAALFPMLLGLFLELELQYLLQFLVLLQGAVSLLSFLEFYLKDQMKLLYEHYFRSMLSGNLVSFFLIMLLITHQNEIVNPQIALSVGFGLFFLITIFLILNRLGLNLLKTWPFYTPGILIWFLAFYTPGILIAFPLVFLCWHRKNMLFLSLSCIFLVYFISVLYYNLDTSLLIKSYTLMGTGLVLGGSGYAFHKWKERLNV